jgi:ABC-type uncharacterized transport system permease subunit
LAKPQGRDSNEFLKYSGMAFEMLAYIGVGILIGRGMDRWIGTSRAYFTLAFALLFLIAYFVRLVKDLSKK